MLIAPTFVLLGPARVPSPGRLCFLLASFRPRSVVAWLRMFAKNYLASLADFWVLGNVLWCLWRILGNICKGAGLWHCGPDFTTRRTTGKMDLGKLCWYEKILT